jgi:hypothetical protein
MKLTAVPVTSKMGMVETAVAPNAERAGVCLGSRAAVPRCGERVSLAPESRPIGSSDTHFLILLGRKRGWDFDRGQRRTAQVGVRCEDDELYGEKRGEDAILSCLSPTTLLKCCGNAKLLDTLQGGLDRPHPEMRNLLGRFIELGSTQVPSIRHARANHGRPSGSLDRVRKRCCYGR